MTVMLPVGRACTRQLVSRSNHLLTRFATSNPLLRVSNRNTENHPSSQSCCHPFDNVNLLTKFRTYATEAATKPRGRPKAHTGRTVTKKSSTKAKKTPAKKAKAKPKTQLKTRARARPKAKPKKPAVKKTPSKTALNKARIAKDKDLKARALLKEPKQLPASAWNLYFAETHKNAKSVQEGAAQTKEAAERFKHLPAEELERLNHTANQNKAKNEVEYKKWVSQYTPLEIKNANLARKKINRELKAKGKKRATFQQIKDERLVKGPKTGYNIFTSERYASGDFKHMSLAEAARLIGREWKALSAEEKQPYNEQGKADSSRYQEEFDTVYQRSPTKQKRGPSV